MYFSWSIMLLTLHLMIIFFLMTKNSNIFLEMEFSPLSGQELNFNMIFDWISLFFLSLVFLISSMVMMYSKLYMSEEIYKKRFIILMMMFVASMMMLILVPNLIGIMIGWDGLGLVSFCLVIFYQNNSSLISGLLTIYMNRMGDVALLISMMILFSSNLWNMFSIINNMTIWAFMFLIVAAMTKSAQIPFSAWLPAAMAAPTPISALVHSSTLVTAGIYLLIRFYYCLSTSMYSKMFCYMSLTTMFVAGFMAWFETDMKKIVAMSTLSQLGLMMYSLSLGEWEFSYFHMSTHALFKSLLFLSCGMMIIFSWGGQDYRLFGSFSDFSPFMKMFLLLSNLSLMGFPFLTGFYSKDLILESTMMLEEKFYTLFLLFSGCILTVLYSLKFLKLSNFMLKMNIVLDLSFEKFSSSLNMIILSTWVIICGSMMSWFTFSNISIMVLNYEKLMGLIVLFMGFFIFYFLNFFKQFINKNIYLFFSDMTHLRWLSTNQFSLYTKSFNKISIFNMKWIELMGPQGLNKNLFFISIIFTSMAKLNFYMLFIFLGLMIIIMLKFL